MSADRTNDSISATSLAKLGVAENEVRRPSSPRREEFAARGRLVHARSAEAARRAPSAPDTRCFVATAVYGTDAWQTVALRAWRDEVLRRSALGRVGIRVYYKVSPTLVRVLTGQPRAMAMVRRMLDRVVRLIGAGR